MRDTITLRQVQEILKADYLTPTLSLDGVVETVCASDFMSDVLAFARPRCLLLTGLVAPQTVRTAEVADMQAICFVFGKEPTDETIKMAEESGIPIFRTPFSLYTASGKLYEMGLRGCDDVT